MIAIPATLAITHRQIKTARSLLSWLITISSQQSLAVVKYFSELKKLCVKAETYCYRYHNGCEDLENRGGVAEVQRFCDILALDRFLTETFAKGMAWKFFKFVRIRKRRISLFP